MSTAPAPLSRSLFVFSILYGGMTCIAGVLAFKQVALGPLAVEAGIFAFLMLVVISSAIAQIHGQGTANRLVLFGFIPLAVSVLLIVLVLSLPASSEMPAGNLSSFETVMAQTPRIMLAGPIAYGVSLLLNVKIFSALRGAAGDSGFGVMVRGAIASALSQSLDTLIFVTVAFYGEFPIGSLIMGQMLAKIVLSAVLVPPLIILIVKLAKRLDESPMS
ncbi:queuosine precursor transporter [Parasphingopyxis sp. CP4]|uniref:queuosine precursor transporter n=1 Tax=Parasphingopyxis sp. CP4 TaxID=2724527 RepID=UPI0015A3F4FF|nr:queuosine precursor transporter [Parasphingopyxis sp. CP4]QLC23049.1 queuosine precursor transporter [Parasphingopyxis sp. CP4]